MVLTIQTTPIDDGATKEPRGHSVLAWGSLGSVLSTFISMRRSIRAGLATKQILQIVATSFPSAVLACDARRRRPSRACGASLHLLLFMTYICCCSHERNFTVLPNECTPSVFFHPMAQIANIIPLRPTGIMSIIWVKLKNNNLT
jgi:hypothetical protein